MDTLIEYILHFDKHLADLIAACGPWIYGVLGGILFGETGLLVLPFLPGDTLLFACGVAAAQKSETSLSLPLLLTLLPLAAILGDTTNYWIGRALRRRHRRGGHIPILSPAVIDRSNRFFAKYGPWAVVLGRWVPLVRTVVPFTAGLSTMTYPRFVTFSAIGNVTWVAVFVMLGYGLGEVKFVKDNIGLVFLGLIAFIVISLLVKALTALLLSDKSKKLPAPGTPPASPSGR